MDLIAPLVKTGAISETINLVLAVPIGFLFGFALFHSGFTDSRKIAWVFYFKEVGLPVFMFAAIVTGMLGLWGLSLIGFLDISLLYFVPTFLTPVAVAGVLFGVGMVVGGYCPGTAVASLVTGKLDALVFFIGFLAGSLIFGDFYPLWDDFHRSSYQGAFRLDQLFHINLGLAVFLIVVIAVAGSLFLRFVQKMAWPAPAGTVPETAKALGVERGLVGIALLLGLVMAFFPNTDYISDPLPEAPYYIIPKAPMTPQSAGRDSDP